MLTAPSVTPAALAVPATGATRAALATRAAIPAERVPGASLPDRSSPPALPGSPPPPVGWAELTAHRGYLVAFARRRLLDPALAEDLVHDVFEAVVTGRAAFAGRSALRSWLVAILKHKIVDLVRERSGHDSLDCGGSGSDDEGGVPALQLECPQPRPDEVAEQRQRLRRTLQRIGELPRTLREAVQLRLLADGDTDEVCRRLAISEANLFVRLHRARRVLAS
ncbi:MAG: sigma-70 family RNA polymerase sigma factor [Burkholderiales bacterium]|nr:sigma-70 family RNA polymerase sigma factor [Burkholderiales bacterium]